MQVRFSQAAEADIIDSYLYGLVNFGQAQAERYEADLKKVVGLIADNPRMARGNCSPGWLESHGCRTKFGQRVASVVFASDQ